MLPVVQTSNVVIAEQPIVIPSSPGVVTGPPLQPTGTFVTGYRAPLFPINPWAVVLATIVSGGLPHNGELNELLALTKVAIGLSATEVGASERGQRIAADVQAILDTVARFLVVKKFR